MLAGAAVASDRSSRTSNAAPNATGSSSSAAAASKPYSSSTAGSLPSITSRQQPPRKMPSAVFGAKSHSSSPLLAARPIQADAQSLAAAAGAQGESDDSETVGWTLIQSKKVAKHRKQALATVVTTKHGYNTAAPADGASSAKSNSRRAGHAESRQATPSTASFSASSQRKQVLAVSVHSVDSPRLRIVATEEQQSMSGSAQQTSAKLDRLVHSLESLFIDMQAELTAARDLETNQKVLKLVSQFQSRVETITKNQRKHSVYASDVVNSVDAEEKGAVKDVSSEHSIPVDSCATPKVERPSTDNPEKKRSWADIATAKPVVLTTPSGRNSPEKTQLTREMLEEKQQRAEAARIESLKSREVKMQSLSIKINQLQSKKEEERRQLQKQLEERLTEAELRRSSLLAIRRDRAKEDRQKELSLINQKNIEQKIVAVKEREEKILARKMELEIGRIRKAEENAAKEEAALVRRNSMEKRRLAKLQVIEERRRELELRKEQERLALLAQREIEKEEKAKRLAEFKSGRISTVHNLKQEIDRKLEKGMRLHDEHIEQVKEKAFAVTDKAREVVARKTPQKRTSSPVQAVLPGEEPADMAKLEALEDDEEKLTPFMAEMLQHPLLLSLDNATLVKAKNVELMKGMQNVAKLLSGAFAKPDSGDAVVENACSSGCRLFAAISLAELDLFLVLKNKSFSLFRQIFDYAAEKKVFVEAEAIASAYSFLARLLVKMPRGSFVGELDSLPVKNLVNLFHSSLSLPGPNFKMVMLVCSYISVILREILLEAYLSTSSDGGQLDNSKCVLHILEVFTDRDLFGLLRTAFTNSGVTSCDLVCVEFIGTAMALLETISMIICSEPYRSTPVVIRLFEAFCRTEFVGVITVLDSMFLFPGFNKGASAASESVLKTSLYAVRALKNIADFDTVAFQTAMVGIHSGDAYVEKEPTVGYVTSVLQNEFYHLVLFWLQISMPQKMSRRDHQHDPLIRVRTSLLHEVIMLIGYYVRGNTKNQQIARIGQYPVILQKLVALPFRYFCDPLLANILLPTLIAACHGDENNYTILQKEMSPSILCQYIDDHLQSLGDATSSPPSWTSIVDPSAPHRLYRPFWKDAKKPISSGQEFQRRFPASQWEQARDWFASK